MTIATPPHAFQLENQLGYQLRRASQAMMADLAERLSPLDLKPSSASILLLIESGAASSPSEIGRVLDIQRSNMAPLTAGLEARGLVRRSSIDGRSHKLKLTRLGAALAAKARQIIQTHEACFQEKFTQKEVDTLVALMPRLWSGT